MLTHNSLGGKPEVGIETTEVVTDRTSSKLALARTGSQKRYVSGKAFSHLPLTLYCLTNTLDSFNYRLRNQRRRRKNQRNDNKIYFLITFLPEFKMESITKGFFVYRCKIKQYS